MSAPETWANGQSLLPIEKRAWAAAEEEARLHANTQRLELRNAGLAIECAAGAVNSAAQRVEAGQSSIDDFDLALLGHAPARDLFRARLEEHTGLSAATIERWLAL